MPHMEYVGGHSSSCLAVGGTIYYTYQLNGQYAFSMHAYVCVLKFHSLLDDIIRIILDVPLSITENIIFKRKFIKYIFTLKW